MPTPLGKHNFVGYFKCLVKVHTNTTLTLLLYLYSEITRNVEIR
jgi:hypothetical protein